MSEEKIREAIRTKIHEHLGLDAASTPLDQQSTPKPFKLSGTAQDSKLDREMPSSTQANPFIIGTLESDQPSSHTEPEAAVHTGESSKQQQKSGSSSLKDILNTKATQNQAATTKEGTEDQESILKEAIQEDQRSADKLKKYLINRKGVSKK